MSAPRDWDRVFREDRDADAAIERGLLVKEVVIVAVLVLLVTVREMLL